MFSIFAVSTVTPLLAFAPTPWIQEPREDNKLSQNVVHQKTITHNWYASDSVVQDYVDYAYDIWGIDFVKLIECENGRWDPKRVSKTHDHWLCQLHYKYNKEFINSSDFKDPYKQLDYCYEKYKTNPELWYWPDRKINWEKCSDYVNDRFDIKLT